MRKIFSYLFQRTIDGLVSLIILIGLFGVGVYASGTSNYIMNYLGTGLDAIEYTNGSNKQSIASDAFHAKNNGTWLGYYGDNYIRSNASKTTYLKGSLTSEDNTNYYVNLTGNSNFNGLCINGTCKTNWPPALGVGCTGGYSDKQIWVDQPYISDVGKCYRVNQCQNGSIYRYIDSGCSGH